MSQRNIGELSVKIGGDIKDLQKAFKQAQKDLKDFQRRMESPEAAFIRKNMDALAMEKATADVKAYNRELAKTKSTYKEIGQSVGSRLTKGIASLFDTKRVDWAGVKRIQEGFRVLGSNVGRDRPGGMGQLIQEQTKDMGFKGALLNLKDGLVDTAKFFTQKLGDGIRAVGRGIRSAGSSLREDFRPKNILPMIGGGIGSVIGAGVSIGRGAIQAAPGILSTSFDLIKGIGSFLLDLPGKALSIFSKLNPFEFLTQSFTQFKTIAVMGLGALTIQAIRLHAEFEAVEVGFAALTKSKSVARELVADVRELATQTPFRSRELLSASKLLLGYGTEVKNIIPALKMLGDVTAAIGGEYINLEHVTYLFGTLQQQGHAFTRDINQFANIGIPIIPELAKILNMRPEEVMGATEAGKVDFGHVLKAFKAMTREGGLFYKFMEEKSKTLAGRWENFKDQAEIALSRIGGMIAEEFNLKNWLQDLSNGLKNIDTWIAKNRADITSFFDVIKGIGGGIAAAFLHVGAGFRVLVDLGERIFPNTFKEMERLVKSGKDLSLSWTDAKSNMINVFEQISVGFASMLDVMVNGFAKAMNAVTMIRRAGPLSGWSTDEQVQHVFNTVPEAKEYQAYKNALAFGISETGVEAMVGGFGPSQAVSTNYMRNVFRRYGKEALFNEIHKADPEFKSAAAKAVLKSGLQYLGSPDVNLSDRMTRAQSEYDRSKGFGLFDTNSSMEKDVKSFWDVSKKTWAAREAERVANEQAQTKWYNENLTTNRLLAGGLASTLGMAAFQNRPSNPLMIQDPLDSTNAGLISASLKQAFGELIGTSFEAVIARKYSEFDKLNLGLWDTIGWNIDRRKDPNREFEDKYRGNVTHEMLEFAKNFKANLHPALDLKKHLDFIKKLGAEGYLDPDEQGRAIGEQLAKAKDALGLGFENVKFADAIYKGTSEAISLENRWMHASNLDSPQEVANAIAAQHLEYAKQARNYLEKIAASMPDQVVEMLAMPREANP